MGVPSSFVYRSLKRQLKHLNKEIDQLEKRLLELVKQDQQQQLTLLKGIPGMGVKTALFLIVITDGFKKFETASQLCSYVGITPTIRELGSSVRGRSKISKLGNKKLRKLLFLCAFSACKHNKACREIYERIVAKGKSKKLALIAVSNKLTLSRKVCKLINRGLKLSISVATSYIAKAYNNVMKGLIPPAS